MSKKQKKPFISVCTPTFNRRPFVPSMIKCFENQTYPKDRMEWIIIDDGTDKIEDLVAHLPRVKYFKYDDKMTLGKKRNLLNEKSSGNIIVYMDDDDYYPPYRVSHAVDALTNSDALCAGSSITFIYFKHIHKMYQFGPYGPNHSTAATFAFKRKLLEITKFDETSCVAEERTFLKGYTIPFVQLDPVKSILVFSHTQNSFDKKELLNQLPCSTIHETPILPSDIVKEADILKFFMEDIDNLLINYEPGSIIYKPDVTKQLIEIKKDRELKQQQYLSQQLNYNQILNNNSLSKNYDAIQRKLNDQTLTIQQLLFENNQLKEQVEYLTKKISQIVKAQIEKRKS